MKDEDRRVKLGLPMSSNGLALRPSFFSNTPFQSYFIIGDTLLLLATLSMLGFILVRYWSLLAAISIYWFGLVGLCMFGIWVVALRSYRRIHELFQRNAGSPVPYDSPLGIAMSSAAGMIHGGLLLAYVMAMGVLMQVAKILSHR